MTDMPKRDTEGKCEGECRDREKEGYEERQSKLESEHKDVESPEEYPNAPKAKKRNEPPGSMGGHV